MRGSPASPSNVERPSSSGRVALQTHQTNGFPKAELAAKQFVGETRKRDEVNTKMLV